MWRAGQCWKSLKVAEMPLHSLHPLLPVPQQSGRDVVVFLEVWYSNGTWQRPNIFDKDLRFQQQTSSGLSLCRCLCSSDPICNHDSPESKNAWNVWPFALIWPDVSFGYSTRMQHKQGRYSTTSNLNVAVSKSFTIRSRVPNWSGSRRCFFWFEV